MYLHELQNALLQATGTMLAQQQLCQCVHNQGLSHKKLIFRVQQNDELRAQFQSDILYFSHMFIFIDETGANTVSHSRT